MKKFVFAIVLSFGFISVNYAQGLQVIDVSTEESEFSFDKVVGTAQGVIYTYKMVKDQLFVGTYTSDNASIISYEPINFMTGSKTKINFLDMVLTQKGALILGSVHDYKNKSTTIYAQLISEEGLTVNKAKPVYELKTITKATQKKLTISTNQNHTKVIVSYFRSAPKSKTYLIDVFVFNSDLKVLLSSSPKINTVTSKKGEPIVDFQVYVDNEFPGFLATLESTVISGDRELNHELMRYTFNKNGELIDFKPIESKGLNVFKPILTASEIEGNMKLTGFTKPSKANTQKDYSGIFSVEINLISSEQKQIITSTFTDDFNEGDEQKEVNPKFINENNQLQTAQVSESGVLTVAFESVISKKMNKNKDKLVLLGDVTLFAMNKNGKILWNHSVPITTKVIVKSSKGLPYEFAQISVWEPAYFMNNSQFTILYKNQKTATKSDNANTIPYQTLWHSFSPESGKPVEDKGEGIFDKNYELVYLTMYSRFNQER